MRKALKDAAKLGAVTFACTWAGLFFILSFIGVDFRYDQLGMLVRLAIHGLLFGIFVFLIKINNYNAKTNDEKRERGPWR